jgi:hypothetical protein
VSFFPFFRLPLKFLDILFMIADHVFHIIFLGKVGSRGIAEKKQEKGEIITAAAA